MTREEAKTIILKHQFAFASMPDDVIEAINHLVKEERCEDIDYDNQVIVKDHCTKQKILNQLSEEPLMVLSTAYLYAKNYVKYGCDVTKAWSTVVEQASILERVKTDTYAEAYDSFKKDYENQLKNDLAAMVLEIQIEIEEIPRYRMTHDGICVYRQPSEYMSDVNNVIKKAIDGLREESEG